MLDRNLVNSTGLAYRILAERWKVTKPEIAILFAINGKKKSTLAILDIYRSLNLLFENEKQADSWVHRPNDYFNGKAALEVMLEDDIGLQEVQVYLKGRLL